MPAVSPMPEHLIPDTHIENKSASSLQNPSSQNSEMSDENKSVVYKVVSLSARRTPHNTVVDISIDKDKYIFSEKNNLKTGERVISFRKNNETEWEKSFSKNTQDTIIMDFAQVFTDQNINRPRPVIRKLYMSSYQYSGSDFCLHLFNLIKPELVTVKFFDFGIFYAVIDSNLLDFINNFQAAKLRLYLLNACDNQELLLNLQSKQQQVHECRPLTGANADLVVEHIKRLISNNDHNSYYQAEQSSGPLPDDFVQNTLAELKSAEPASHSKFFHSRHTTSPVPLTHILPVTPTTDLEIYSDKRTIVAVLAESETFPPADMNKLPSLVLGKNNKTHSDTERRSCCLLASCCRGS